MQQGKLIVIEGIDGSGTTTQAKRLVDTLEKQDISSSFTCQPSDGPIGKLLRDILHKQCPVTDESAIALLFAADRMDHVRREIIPALERGTIVISDRWYYSSLAYQNSEDHRWIRTINEHCRKPDLIIFLEVDPQVAQHRCINDNRIQERYDALETQKKIAQVYQDIFAKTAQDEPVVHIDGHQSLEHVASQILKACNHAHLW